MKTIGEIKLSIPGDEHNPRTGEGGFFTLKDGTIMNVISRYYESTDDAAETNLVALYSYDNGETWGDERVLLTTKEHEGARMIGSACLLRMQNGDIGLFYGKKGPAGGDCSMVMRRSSDEGKTWSEYVRCQPREDGYFVVNNDRVVRLSNGRLVVPAQYHRGEQNFSVETVLYASDDDGYTWKEMVRQSLPFCANTKTGLQEPGVIEMKNGVVWVFARTDFGRQFECFSVDNLHSLTPYQPSRFTSPATPLSMKRDPNTGRLIAVWCPEPNYNGRFVLTGVKDGTYRGRTPLVAAWSDDDGVTWSEVRPLDVDPNRNYCYIAMEFTSDNALLLGYYSIDDGFGDGYVIRKVKLDELYGE